MPINSTHPTYDQFLPRWQTIRDAYAGSEVVREAAERYLPKPSGMKGTGARKEAWDAYIRRPEWFPATSRTVDGLTGAIFRRDPQIDIPRGDASDLLRQDITGTGISLLSFLQTVTKETLKIGRYGILLDYSTEWNMPVWSGYDAESILNWDEEDETFIVLEEHTWEPSRSQEGTVVMPEAAVGRVQLGAVPIALSMQHTTTWRILSLLPDSTGQQVYRQDVWRQIESTTATGQQRLDIEHIETIVPMFREQPLDFIPFVCIGPDSTDLSVQDSIILHLVRLNYRHWRHCADYEHALHLTCIPTPYVTGYNPNDYAPVNPETGQSDEAVFIMGSGEASIFPPENAKVGLLTMSADDLGAMIDALDKDKKDMATVGARLLEEQPQVEEREIAVKLRRSGDESTLKTLANTVSFAMSIVLRWDRWWRGETGDEKEDEAIGITLNTDFVSIRLGPQDITAMQSLQEGGHISRETLFWNLQQGELIEPGIPYDDEQARIEAAPPVTMRLSPFGDALDDEESRQNGRLPA